MVADDQHSGGFPGRSAPIIRESQPYICQSLWKKKKLMDIKLKRKLSIGVSAPMSLGSANNKAVEKDTIWAAKRNVCVWCRLPVFTCFRGKGAALLRKGGGGEDQVFRVGG